jgi:hypothetical protein
MNEAQESATKTASLRNAASRSTDDDDSIHGVGSQTFRAVAIRQSIQSVCDEQANFRILDELT